MSDIRLDLLLVEKRLVISRTVAQQLITAALVTVDGTLVVKSNRRFPQESCVVIADMDDHYVSRGGKKLEAALNAFDVDVHGKVCLDIGISTGGFSQCLLKHGAVKVIGIDVGHGQLHRSLVDNDRIELREGVNARNLLAADFGRFFPVVTIDVSFISLKLILPAVQQLVDSGGAVICLIKPQFEVGQGNLGKNGIVDKPHLRESAVASVHDTALSLGFMVSGSIQSPIAGGDGNIEYLSLLRR